MFENKSILNDSNSRGHLIRLEKARQENEDKRKRVYWNCPGSLIKQTTHYSNSYSLQNCLTTKEESSPNPTLEDEIYKNCSHKNFQFFQKNLRDELKNIEALTIETESDEDRK